MANERELIREAPVRGCLGWLVRGLVGFASFVAGAALTLIALAPALLSDWFERNVEASFGERHGGQLLLGSAELGWMREQELTGIELVDPSGEAVLSGSLTFPPMGAILTRQAGDEPLRVHGQLDGTVVVDAEGRCNLDAALGLRGEEGMLFDLSHVTEARYRVRIDSDRLRIDDRRPGGQPLELTGVRVEARLFRGRIEELKVRGRCQLAEASALGPLEQLVVAGERPAGAGEFELECEIERGPGQRAGVRDVAARLGLRFVPTAALALFAPDPALLRATLGEEVDELVVEVDQEGATRRRPGRASAMLLTETLRVELGGELLARNLLDRASWSAGKAFEGLRLQGSCAGLDFGACLPQIPGIDVRLVTPEAVWAVATLEAEPRALGRAFELPFAWSLVAEPGDLEVRVAGAEVQRLVDPALSVARTGRRELRGTLQSLPESEASEPPSADRASEADVTFAVDGGRLEVEARGVPAPIVDALWRAEGWVASVFGDVLDVRANWPGSGNGEFSTSAESTRARLGLAGVREGERRAVRSGELELDLVGAAPRLRERLLPFLVPVSEAGAAEQAKELWRMSIDRWEWSSAGGPLSGRADLRAQAGAGPFALHPRLLAVLADVDASAPVRLDTSRARVSLADGRVGTRGIGVRLGERRLDWDGYTDLATGAAQYVTVQPLAGIEASAIEFLDKHAAAVEAVFSEEAGVPLVLTGEPPDYRIEVGTAFENRVYREAYDTWSDFARGIRAAIQGD